MACARHLIARQLRITLLLACSTLVAVAQAGRVATAAAHLYLQSPDLQVQLEALAKLALPGTLGVAIVDLQSGSAWGVNADQAFPMMSDFKAMIAAAVLSRVDAGTLTLEQQVTLKRPDVVPGSAVPSIGEMFRGERMQFTVRQLLEAAVSQSDNTAADALITLLGGPNRVTHFLEDKGITPIQVNEKEGGMARIFDHLQGATAPPPGETAQQQEKRLHAGYQAFVAAPPNHATPRAAALFLSKLWAQQLLARSSTQYLLGLMYAQTIPHRLRDGLPAHVRLADKTGTSSTVDGVTAAYNDIGLITWPDGYAVAIAVFLTQSKAPAAEREALFAQLAQEAVMALHHP